MKKEIYTCAVIGGGAAGMMAAITAARRGVDVIIIEHTERIGTKLLQTGNGKCNFTNLLMNSDMYQNDAPEFAINVIKMFNQNETIDFFKSLGVFPKNVNGYVYPHSETAASLQDALRNEIVRLGISVKCGYEIKNIERKDDKFIIDDFIICRKIIFSTGSKASPGTGSDGSGYRLVKKLGIKIMEPLPALVPLESSFKYCKTMSGVRSTGLVRIIDNKKEIAKDIGQIQYTDYGISGIPVFQVSRYAVKAVKDHGKTQAVIDMIPDITENELDKYISENIEKNKHKSIEQLFSGIINKKLVQAAAFAVDVQASVTLDNVSEKALKKIIKQLKSFKFEITGYKSFEKAQICQGGVKLEEINPQTMESKKISGMYFAGEILDVDGKCGGYNLQWAWSSGYIAGMNAAGNKQEIL